MEMLINVQSGKIGQIVERMEGKVTLIIEGVQTTRSNSTIKRWWKKYTQPQPTTITTPPTTSHFERVVDLFTQVQELGFKLNQTKSYTGIKFGNKTVAEVHVTKKGKITIVVSHKVIHELVLSNWIADGIAVVVPESYGWTLNTKIHANELSDELLISLITSATGNVY